MIFDIVVGLVIFFVVLPILWDVLFDGLAFVVGVFCR